MPASYPRIPYGWADFKAIRLENRLYVDKTRFVHALEEERYVFLIRPRRFGKSCWVSLLDNYYERNRADAFEAVFGGTHLGRQPTDNRHRYVVLRFNFSAFDDTLETLRERFETYCHLIVRHALERNRDLFPEKQVERILSLPSIDAKLSELFLYAGDQGIPLYVLIDEYDNFANTVLAYHGTEAYQSFTHGGGFYRNFFATLKDGAGQSGGGLERMFITGVSPITMDDVTSGFNIGKNISLHSEFNDMLGFTEEEVRNLLEMYRDYGVFNQEVEAALAVMREWYNGYRFAKSAQGDLYNTDMVLYFLDESIPNRGMPDELIDTNVRIDYGKLRHLLTVNRQLNGNFDLLRHIIGEQTAESNIQLSFPLDRLDRRENFLSLLHYFGLLSIRDVSYGVPRLGIPNQTVKRLMYGYLRDAYDDVGVFSVDVYTFSRLMRQMAYEGAWQPVLDFLRDALAEQTGIRDYIDGEKVVHGFVAAHFSMIDQFLLHSEYELNKGYADLYLEPFVAQYSDMRYGYVLELKYLKRSEALDESLVADKVQEAVLQLRSYLADSSLPRRYPSVQHLGLAMVFHGWELVAYEAVGDAEG
ncbi:MAG: AAA family ATPase [Gemmatimonadetes bacterium]|nr:AAA family ATPase [Gemmatimonadota bacterium]MYB68066.1 AAA family ATPase [Gemmatimonadota bacterium]